MAVIDPLQPLNFTNVSFASEEFQKLVSDINYITNLFQAIGGIFIVWAIISLIRLYLLRKRERKIEEMRRDVKELKKFIYKLKKGKH